MDEFINAGPCPECGTERVFVTTPGGIQLGWMWDCDCMANREKTILERRGEEETIRLEVDRNLMLEKQRQKLPAFFRQAVEGKSVNEGHVSGDIKKFLADGPYQNLCVAGNSFSGKTFDVSWLLYKMGVKSFYVLNPAEIVSSIWGKEATNGIEDYGCCKILVIDDVDKTRTRREQDMLFNIADMRHKAGLATWVTTNVMPDALLNILDVPLYNRVIINAVKIFKNVQYKGAQA